MDISRALIVINPAANHGGTAQLIPVAAKLLDGCFPHDMVLTESGPHAQMIAAEAQGYDVLIAMGGDGTAHEILNGIMSRPVDDRPALTILPTGSGNDYARTLGIPNDLSQAVIRIASGRRDRVDVGTCNGLYFANTLAVGLDAQVTSKAMELKATTGRTGLPLYLSALMHVLFKEYRHYSVQIQVDDEPPIDREILLLAMTHGPTYGGGFYITPHAIGGDGLMDMCLIDAIPLWQALWRVPFIIPGRHEWMRVVHTDRRRRVRVSSEQPIPGQIDGEVMMTEHYDVGVDSNALEVIVPMEDD